MKKIIILTLLTLLLSACGPAVRSSRSNIVPNANDIKLSGGAYSGTYLLSQSGTEADPIIVWGNGSTLQCVEIRGSYIVWQDTKVTGCASFGIRIKGAHVQVLNNIVTDVVRSNWDGSKCSGAGSWDSAIRAADTTDVMISGNLVYRVCGEGISVLRSSYVAVENNVVYDAFSVNIYVDQASFSTVLNNWSYSTSDARYYKSGQVARGVSIGAESYSGWTFSVSNLIIEGNKLERVRGINFIQEQAGTPFNVIVRDNQFINVAAPLVNLGSWATVSGNVSVTATPGGTVTTVTATATASATASATRTPTATSPAPTSSGTPVPITATPTAACSIFEDESVWVMVCPK